MDITGRYLLSQTHYSDEGLIFTDPTLLLDSQVSSWESQNFPDASTSVLSEINKYYPPPLEAMSRYMTDFDRVEELIAGNSRSPHC